MSNYPQPSQEPDCVEAEIVYNGGDKEESARIFGKTGGSGTSDGHKKKTSGRSGPDNADSGNEKVIKRINTVFKGFGGIMLLLGLLLCTGGIFLTTTVIGIIFGIPMIIAGFVLIWLGITFCGAGPRQ